MNISEQKTQFDQQGYVVAKQLFSPEEVATFRDHFMKLRAEGPKPGDDAGVDVGSNDPLKRFPRMIQMHQWDAASLDFMTDPRIAAMLSGLLGAEPYAVQTMLYFKPAGARGQALHQDNYYLRVQPGTCMAAWLALDPCDEDNGCMRVVPGSHTWPVLCSVKADTTQSFTDVTVPLPEGTEAAPVVMEAGDVLFFNGQLVHGSYPNSTSDRFRRALIGHYVQAEAEKVGRWYHPVLRMDGSEVDLGIADGGSKCGVWIDQDGEAAIEVSGYQLVEKQRE